MFGGCTSRLSLDWLESESLEVREDERFPMETTGSDFRQTALLYQTDGWEGYQDRDAVGVLLVGNVWRLCLLSSCMTASRLAELCLSKHGIPADRTMKSRSSSPARGRQSLGMCRMRKFRPASSLPFTCHKISTR